jgi:hypothetical protein
LWFKLFHTECPRYLETLAPQTFAFSFQDLVDKPGIESTLPGPSGHSHPSIPKFRYGFQDCQALALAVRGGSFVGAQWSETEFITKPLNLPATIGADYGV